MAKSRNRLFADLVKTFYREDDTGGEVEVTQTIRSKRSRRIPRSTETVIDSVNMKTVSAITYYISAERNDNRHFLIISAVQKSSTDCDYNEFGEIITDSKLADFRVRINNGYFELLANPVHTNTDFKVTRIAVT